METTAQEIALMKLRMKSVEDKLPKTSIDEELLYFANMLYATSKDDTKRVNSIVDGIHKLKQ